MGLSLCFYAEMVLGESLCRIIKNIRSSFGRIADYPPADNSYKLGTEYNQLFKGIGRATKSW